MHGVARAGYATVFPQSITIAASWDDGLVHQVASVISDEARAKETFHTTALQAGELAQKAKVKKGRSNSFAF